MKNMIRMVLFCGLAFAIFSCKKKKDAHVPPDVQLKTGAGYTYADATVPQNDTLLVGITATKTEDDLKSFNISVSYDGSASTVSKFTEYMTSAQYSSYSKDCQVITRGQAGSERWVFTIIDRDGNVTQKSINLTVQ